MYAVIDTGGKQARVKVGERLEVELLDAAVGEEVSFAPKLVVDGAEVVSSREPLSLSNVSARVLGTTKGPKIVGFTYKAKARGRRRFGHRQHYTTVEITGIDSPGLKTAAETADAPSKD